MVDIPELLALAESDEKKERKNAVNEMGKLDEQFPQVMDRLRSLESDDPDKGVRKEAKKALESLSNKSMNTADASTEVEVEDGEQLDPGQYDYDSNLSDAEEDRREAFAAGKGLMVVLKEQNKIQMDFYGNVLTTEKSIGEIKVSNTGTKDRISGVDLILENIEGVTSEQGLLESSSIGMLRPGDENAWKVEYEFEKDVSSIKVEQSYVDSESGLSPNFVGGAEKDFEAKIVITNTSDVAISNIKGIKSVNELASISNTSATVGDVQSNQGQVDFTISELGPGESATVTCNLTASLPEDVPSYKAGELTINYNTVGELASGVGFKSVDGVSTIRQRVKRKQRETEPGFYDCQIIFQNLSEFVYDLNKFSVFAGNMEGSDLVLDWDGSQVSEDEREIVPGEQVDFEFVYESLEGAPSFGEHVEFSVQYEIETYTSTQIILPSEDLKFMAVQIAKQYMINGESVNRFEIPSYVETEIPTVLTVSGVGSFPLEGLIVKDEIPTGFKSPVDDQIIVSRGDVDLEPSEYQVSLSTSEEDMDELTIQFDHLEETNLGGLNEGDEITIKYVQVADNPKEQEDKISTKSTVEGFIYLAPESKVTATAINDDLELIIIHVRDDLEIGKVIEAIDYEGQDAFRIRLEADNFGSSTVDMEIQDLVPNGFNFVESTLETEPEAENLSPESSSDGTVYGVKFTNVEPDQSVYATYVVVQESSDANPRKLQSVYRG